MFTRTRKIILISGSVTLVIIVIGAALFSGILLTKDEEKEDVRSDESTMTTMPMTESSDKNTLPIVTKTTSITTIRTTTKISTTANIAIGEPCKFASQIANLSEGYGYNGGSQVVLADLNHDNRNDIVFTDSKTERINILLGYDQGSFSGFQEYFFTEDIEIDQFTLVDVNNDNDLDIIGSNIYEDDFSILLGFGDGSFSYFKRFESRSFHSGGYIDAGYLNGDNYIDLVFTRIDYAEISIWCGRESIDFSPVQKLDFKYKTLGFSTSLGDFNSDHALDIVVMLDKMYLLQIFFGTGNGTVKSTPVSTQLKEESRDMKIVDLNKDGYLDVILSGYASNTITLLFGIGNGTFRDHIQYSTGLRTAPTQLSINYFNSDQYIDLAVIYRNSSQLGMFLGSPNGKFQYHKTINFSNTRIPLGLDTGDINNDNRTDIVVTHPVANGISILLQTC